MVLGVFSSIDKELLATVLKDVLRVVVFNELSLLKIYRTCRLVFFVMLNLVF